MGNEKEGSVLAHIGKNGVCNIKLVGQIRYNSSAKGFMDFVSANVADRKVKDVIVDLRTCEYIDSTDIGVLAKIATLQENKGEKKPTLVYCEESSVSQAISDVSVNLLFDVYVGKEISEQELYEVENSNYSLDEITKIMYDSHKLLCDLDDLNKEKFGKTVILLKESVTAIKKKAKAAKKTTK